MKALAALVLVLGLAANAQAQVIEERCESTPLSSSPSMQIAFTTLSSFHYVLHTFNEIAKELPGAEYCVTGMPMSRNAYQYLQYFIQIDVRSAGRTHYRLRYLYQDASIQAYHNAHGQPWVAIAPATVDAVVEGALAKADFRALDSAWTTPVEMAKLTRSYASTVSEVDEKTLSVLPLSEDSYLVAWMTRSPANPYAGVARTMAIVVKRGADGRPVVAENLSAASDLLFPLDKARIELGAEAGAKDAWAAKVLEISKQ